MKIIWRWKVISILFWEFTIDKFEYNDFWGNEYAIQGGLQWSPRFLPMDVNAEFSAVHQSFRCC